MRLRGLMVLAAAAAVVLVPAATPATLPQLIGTVGPGFSITITHPDGSPVTQIDPGTYEVVVHDLAIEHNFHLSGPGVNQATVVETEGDFNWTVTFVEGRYSVVCDPHSLQMHREFVAGNPPPPPTPPPPKPATPKLLATVGPSNTISLKSASGKALKTRQGGRLLDHRSRPLEGAQLPPRRQGRQPQVRPRRGQHGDVEGQALGRGAPLLLRQEPQDGQGLGQGHLGPAARLDQAGVLAACRADLGLPFEL